MTTQTSPLPQETLPFCCPPPNQPVWNRHPRVYLSLEDAGEKTGQATCPYCGQDYVFAPPSS